MRGAWRAALLSMAMLLPACDLLPGATPKAVLHNPHAPGSALHESTQVFIDGFNADPQLQSHYADSFNRDGMYAAFPEAVGRGAQSLDAATLQAALVGLKRAITSLPAADCALFFRPRNERPVGMSLRMQRGFENIPPKYHAALMRYYLAALKAEAADAPPVKVDAQVREAAFRHLSMQYTGAAAERLNRVAAAPASASDEDLCWMGNTLLNGVERLGEREREAATRALLGH